MGASTAPKTPQCSIHAICLGPTPLSYGMERTSIPEPIMAAMLTPMAIQPCLATMFMSAGDEKTAAAVAAVIPMLAPKYMYVSRIRSLTYAGHTT